MSNAETVAQMAGKTSRNALQRVEALETALPNVVESVNRGFASLQQEMTRFGEVIDALVSLAGSEKVSEAVKSARVKRYEERVALEKGQIDNALLAGAMKTADVISELSLVVFNETKNDGTPLETGSRVQYSIPQLKPEFREQLIGKGVGATLTSDESHLFTVTEIYETVPATKTEGAQ